MKSRIEELVEEEGYSDVESIDISCDECDWTKEVNSYMWLEYFVSKHGRFTGHEPISVVVHPEPQAEEISVTLTV